MLRFCKSSVTTEGLVCICHLEVVLELSSVVGIFKRRLMATSFHFKGRTQKIDISLVSMYSFFFCSFQFHFVVFKF